MLCISSFATGDPEPGRWHQRVEKQLWLAWASSVLVSGSSSEASGTEPWVPRGLGHSGRAGLKQDFPTAPLTCA